ncbi:MAG: flagellar biosynthesis protein FlhF [Magnetococcales bacterium]|nr:flagellar biosynthesis protein FlhF [Magnetococcales bacterium]
MNITKFQARDMREALQIVKEQLGPDAVILSTRSIREKGPGGLALGKTMIEVSACPSPAAQGGAGGGARTEPGRFSAVVDDPIERAEPEISARASEPRARPERNSAQANTRAVGSVGPGTTARTQAASRDSARDSNRDSARDAYRDVEPTMPSPIVQSLGDLPPEFPLVGDASGLDVMGKRHYGTLLMHGVEEPIARKIAMMDQSGKERGLDVAFSRTLKFRDPLDGKSRVIVLVGPTGVGKTTTLAKLAADLILNRQRSVGMITLDTFRVGAVAQLETYAKLLQVRLVVARTLSEVKAGLHSLNRCDFVLVDTVGSSPYNRRQVNSTAGLLPIMGDDREVILTMAANVRETEQQAIFRRFSVLRPTGLIFTKLDETVTYGGILNVAVRAGLPLTMYTDGQRVPENLGWMSPKTMARWFLEERDLDQ